eukprot:c40636_g1_i1 orf=101-427(-)
MNGASLCLQHWSPKFHVVLVGLEIGKKSVFFMYMLGSSKCGFGVVCTLPFVFQCFMPTLVGFGSRYAMLKRKASGFWGFKSQNWIPTPCTYPIGCMEHADEVSLHLEN